MLGQEPCLVRKNLWNCLVNLPESWLAKKILHWERTHDYSWSKKGKKNYILVILHWTLSMCKYCLELSTNSSDVYTGKPIRQKLLVLFKKPWYRVYPCPRTTRVSLTSSWRLSTLLILNTCNRWYVTFIEGVWVAAVWLAAAVAICSLRLRGVRVSVSLQDTSAHRGKHKKNSSFWTWTTQTGDVMNTESLAETIASVQSWLGKRCVLFVCLCESWGGEEPVI